MIIPSPNVSHLGNAFSDHSNHGDTTHISRANQHSLHYALSAKNGGGEPQRQGLGNRKRQGPAADFGAASWLPICAIDSPEAHPSQNSKNHQNIPVAHNQNGVRNPGACSCRSWASRLLVFERRWALTTTQNRVWKAHQSDHHELDTGR